MLGGVLILGVGNLLVKLIGLMFKIPLSRLLGDEGMGYFNTGYTVYSWMYLIGCTGFPVAVSMLVAEATEREGENRGDARRVLYVSLLFLIALGSAGFLFLLLLSGKIASAIGNPGSQATVAAIAPSVLFCAISGGVRGYFQGKRRMGPTALSQLIEASLKLILGMTFARRAIVAGYDLPSVAAASIRGVTVGTVASTLFLLFQLFSERGKDSIIKNGKERGSGSAISRRLALIAFPVTFSATVMSLTGLIDLLFVMKRLAAAGFGQNEATALFGNYSTLAVPFFNLPGILISPIATGIVPYITSDLARGDTVGAKRRCATAIRAAVILSFPAAFALGLFGKRILSLFFLDASASLAAPALAALAPGIVFLAIVTVTSAILQAEGRAGVTVVSMLIGATVKTFAGYYLTASPRFGIKGAALGTVLCYGVAAFINLVALYRSLEGSFGIRDLIGPVLPSSIAFGTAYLLPLGWGSDGDAVSTLAVLCFAGVLYGFLCLLFGVVKGEDLKECPVLQKIVSLSRIREDTKPN